MFAILEPISAGIIVSLINRFLLPRLVVCLSPPVQADNCDSPESASINADVEVHCH